MGELYTRFLGGAATEGKKRENQGKAFPQFPHISLSFPSKIWIFLLDESWGKSPGQWMGKVGRVGRVGHGKLHGVLARVMASRYQFARANVSKRPDNLLSLSHRAFRGAEGRRCCGSTRTLS